MRQECWSLSQQFPGERQEDRSPVQYRAHTIHSTRTTPRCSRRVFICFIFLSSDGALSERQPRPVPCDLCCTILRLSRISGPVMVTNEALTHNDHPSINKKCRPVIELNSSTPETSDCAWKNTLDRSSHFIRRGSETQARPADKRQ